METVKQEHMAVNLPPPTPPAQPTSRKERKNFYRSSLRRIWMQREPPDKIPTSLLLKELEETPALKHGAHSPVFPGAALSTWGPIQATAFPRWGIPQPCPQSTCKSVYAREGGVLISCDLPTRSWSVCSFSKSRDNIFPLSCERPARLAGFSIDILQNEKAVLR